MVKRIFLISLFILAPLFADTQAMADQTEKLPEPTPIIIGRNPVEKNIPLDLSVMRRTVNDVLVDEEIAGVFYEVLLEIPTPYSMQDLFGGCLAAVARTMKDKGTWQEGIGQSKCMDFMIAYMESIQGAREYLPHYVLQ